MVKQVRAIQTARKTQARTLRLLPTARYLASPRMISLTRINRVWSPRSASASFRLMNFTVSSMLGIRTY